MTSGDDKYIKGRGAQHNTSNRFLSNALVWEHVEGLDEEYELSRKTTYFEETPKKIVNEVKSPDIPLEYSANPYQGCEHGCIYCYARNTHEYWGFSSGIDFESKIIIKKNAPQLLEKQFMQKNWRVAPIMLSGNTDCYQPVESKLQITRKMLEVCLKFKHSISVITKNSLILRDLDILQELSKDNLVSVAISVTSLDEDLRRHLEPRTASAVKRIDTIKQLSQKGIPTMVMIAPIIPGLNSHEIPEIMKRTSEAGALTAGYTMVRLNGSIAEVFEKWIRTAYPDKADKVLNSIRYMRNGELGSNTFGERMRGSGNESDAINKLFLISRKKYFGKAEFPKLDCSLFSRPGQQLGLF